MNSTATRYNHAYDIAFEVISTDPEGCTPAEFLAALKQRVADLEDDPGLLRECGPEAHCPFDTHEVE